MRPAHLLALCLAATGCNDIERFSTAEGEVYRGRIIDACFMRRGFASATELCMTFDASRAEGGAGLLWTSDRKLDAAPLRVISELLHDPLSTLSFGEGRNRNLVYVVSSAAGDGAGDMTAVLSLMHAGTAEVRLLRGSALPDADPCPDGGEALFAVFAPLTKVTGSCSF